MIEVAEAINGFPVLPDDQLLVLTTGQLRAIISDAVRQATSQLEARVEALEACHNDTPVTQKRPENPGQVDGHLEDKIMALQAELEHNFEATLTEVARDRQRLTALEEARSSRVDVAPSPPGAKTAHRLEQMRTILKERGSTTFKEMERLLRISPKEMNRLLARADKRSFEIFTREGDRRQKVLRLRAQIR